MSKVVILIFVWAFVFVGCEDGEKKYQETLEKQASENIKAKNEDIERWTANLRSDLDRRWKFMEAVSGEFEGSYISSLALPSNLNSTTKKLWIRAIITPSIPYYEPDRIRTVRELENELSNLKLNIQVLHWLDDASYTASGCNFEDVWPDFKKGTIELFDKNCGATYKISITNSDSKTLSSAKLSKSIMTSKVKIVNSFSGIMQTNSYAESNAFTIRRIK